MKKRLLSLVLTFAILVSLLTMYAPVASANTFGGTTGNITWSVVIPTGSATGTLSISPRAGVASAPIPHYTSGSRAPWYAHNTQVHRIELASGINAIGNWAFADFGNKQS